MNETIQQSKDATAHNVATLKISSKKKTNKQTTMGQVQTTTLQQQEAGSCSDKVNDSNALAQKAEQLFAARNIPRLLRDQVQNLLGAGSDSSASLHLQGLTMDLCAAEVALQTLNVVQHKTFSPAPAVSTLAIERKIKDTAALNALAGYLWNQKRQFLSSHHQVTRLALSFWSFGSDSAARQNCSALLHANTQWQSIDFQHCNFENDEETTDMSFLTAGLEAQSSLQEFKLSHGILVGSPALGDEDVAELLGILATKADTLRSVVLRDMYDGAETSAGQAAGEALVELVETCHLEKLVWDIPCTHELYKEGSELQQRFLKAVEESETLVSLQVRRLSTNSPLATALKECVQRKQGIQRTNQASQPMGRSLRMAVPASASLPSKKMADSKNKMKGRSAKMTTAIKRVSFNHQLLYTEFSTREPAVALMRGSNCSRLPVLMDHPPNPSSLKTRHSRRGIYQPRPVAKVEVTGHAVAVAPSGLSSPPKSPRAPAA